MGSRLVPTRSQKGFVATLLFASLISVGSACTAAEPEPIPVILLTVDTLRADHLPAYGYSRNTAPNLTALAADSVVFERAFSPRGKTSPAYASLLTGTYPYRNGVTKLGMRLPGVRVTVAEVLATRDYTRRAFVSSTIMKSAYSNFGQGFEGYDENLPTNEHDRAIFERKGDKTSETILSWLSSGPELPFLFAHWIDPHGPYMAPDRAKTIFSDGPRTHELRERDVPKFQAREGFRFLGEYVDAYDTEIAFVDEAIGSVIRELKAQDLYDRSLIIFTADHGEALGENEVFFRHGWRLHDADVRVPLFVKPPGKKSDGAPKDWKGAVSLVDVFPTVLDYVGVTTVAGLGKIDGISLRPIVEGGGGDAERVVFSDRGPGAVRHLAAHHGEGTLLATGCPRADDERLTDCTLKYYEVGDPGQLKGVTGGQRYAALLPFLQGYAEAIATHEIDTIVERRFSANDFREDHEAELKKKGATPASEKNSAREDSTKPADGGAQDGHQDHHHDHDEPPVDEAPADLSEAEQEALRALGYIE
jgi:arylsulfatase A-like enzyme